MADLTGTNLDPNVEESGGGFTVIPAGKYKAVIIADRITDTKNGSGKMLEMKVQIIDGPQKGETLTDRLNIVNASAQAQAIGQGQLKRICGLCGVQYPPTSTEGLIGKPMQITVEIEEFTSNKTGNTLKSNKIKAYNDVNPVADPAPAKPAAVGGW